MEWNPMDEEGSQQLCREVNMQARRFLNYDPAAPFQLFTGRWCINLCLKTDKISSWTNIGETTAKFLAVICVQENVPTTPMSQTECIELVRSFIVRAEASAIKQLSSI